MASERFICSDIDLFPTTIFSFDGLTSRRLWIWTLDMAVWCGQLLGLMNAFRCGRLLLAALARVAEPVLRALAHLMLLDRLRRSFEMWHEHRERITLSGEDPDSHDRVDCHVLYDPQCGDAIRADAVFIHGINGSVQKTWRKGRTQPGSCWPRDWLPLDCPDVRVVALEYKTDPYLWRPVWVPDRPSRHKTLRDRSKKMMEALEEHGIGDRPIVWVAHSKGGLLVKQILVDAVQSCLKLVTNTQGIVFYSVPHHGSWLATLRIPCLLGQSREILEMRKDCPEIQDLHKKFLSLYEHGLLQAEVVSFVESLPTPLYFTHARIVDEKAADLGVGQSYVVSKDHKDVCKPSRRKSFMYQELTQLINRTI